MGFWVSPLRYEDQVNLLHESLITLTFNSPKAQVSRWLFLVTRLL